MKTSTPRTDAKFKDHEWDMHDHIPLEFARQLESELNAALAQIGVLMDWIREEGVRTDTCTFSILGELCPGCRCERMDARQGKGVR